MYQKNPTTWLTTQRKLWSTV